jgi:tetratricopeptide (TPR) repeat protein
MDLQEFEGLVASAITDEQSTEPCRRRFEKKLADLEQRGEQYVERTFTRQKKFFAEMIRLAMDGKSDAGAEAKENHSDRLDRLSSKVRSVPKTDAFSLIQSCRRLIRMQIPEFKRRDDVEKLVAAKFAGMFSGRDREMLLRCLVERDIPGLFLLAANLFEDRETVYFEILADEFPEDKSLARKFAHLALSRRKDYQKALEKLYRLNPETPADIELYATVARKAGSGLHMKNSLYLLENHLDEKDCLIAFALNADKIQDRGAMTTALEKLEDDRNDLRCLTIYSKLARKTRDTWRMEIAIDDLQQNLPDPHCLCQFAALAKDFGDKAKMEIAMMHLVDHLDDVKCLTIYAGIARFLDDRPEMERCLILLEPHIDKDEYCLSTFASIARNLQDERRSIIALSRLKKHLGNPRQKKLYVSVADRSGGRAA